MKFGLNQMTAPRLPILEFFGLAQRLRCTHLELRNDLPRTLFDGFEAAIIRSAIAACSKKPACLSEIHALRTAGFDGPLSFEAFAPGIHDLVNPYAALRSSIDTIQNAGRVKAA